MVDPVFVAVSIVTIGAAIAALEFRELIYGAIALAVALLGIAIFFIILDAQFVAMFQITIYVGAVVVLIIFTIMLVRKESWLEHSKEGSRKILGIILGVCSMLLIIGVYIYNGLNMQTKNSITIKDISEMMLSYYSPALILLGLTLASAVIGALVLAKMDKT